MWGEVTESQSEKWVCNPFRGDVRPSQNPRNASLLPLSERYPPLLPGSPASNHREYFVGVEVEAGPEIILRKNGKAPEPTQTLSLFFFFYKTFIDSLRISRHAT